MSLPKRAARYHKEVGLVPTDSKTFKILAGGDLNVHPRTIEFSRRIMLVCTDAQFGCKIPSRPSATPRAKWTQLSI